MSQSPINDKQIVLGVTGSIACYKAADLASKLSQAGARVDTILTGSATQFISPLTFQSVTGRRAYVDADLWGSESHVLHVGLGHTADLIVVAPATANTLAKLANGLADNLLTVSVLAATCPLLVAPAMDAGMYAHAATQENVSRLQGRGVTVVGPEEGHLASGLVAKGRMTEPPALLGVIRHLLARNGPLAGRKIVVTAGGTREPLDPVRFLGNRSSGKQGYALAQAALDLGAEVTLISSVGLSIPAGANLVSVDTALEMGDAVLASSADADALIMAAAVADFRPDAVSKQKIKKGGGVPTVTLARNPDILAEVAERKQRSGFPQVTVGFAAETQDLLANAQSKLERKGLDLIAANDVGAGDAGFAVDTNRVTLLYRDGRNEVLPLLGKEEVAQTIMARVEEKLNSVSAMGFAR
jgi:phosphopantothenoylcysteine decarboxylase/phosphopantothenate--cysteine ligase